MAKYIRVLKLGTTCLDKATKLEGVLTNWIIDMGEQINYFFQPKGLNSEGQPKERLFLEQQRLDFKETDFESVEIPVEILGTQVTDKISGFTGMAVEFVRHMNGCFHVVVQPAGLLPSGNLIKRQNFDLRECVGEKIPVPSEKELEESKRVKPSPSGGEPVDHPLLNPR